MKGIQYTITPLHESALLISWGNRIGKETHAQVMGLYQALLQNPVIGMQELVPAFSSLAVYYDPAQVKKSTQSQTSFDALKAAVEDIMANQLRYHFYSSRIIRIPVYYHTEGTDLQAMSDAKAISKEEIIYLHTERRYDVYMLGFLPGFAYMAEVDERIAVPRKSQPQPVKAGSVGIAGIQTGIYPIDSPGGWQIIGHTPLSLFDINNENKPCLLQPGDQVEFYAITADEFNRYQSRTA